MARNPFGGSSRDEHFARRCARFPERFIHVADAGAAARGLHAEQRVGEGRVHGRLLDAHLGTVFATCRAAAPRMVAAGGGAIVNIASILGAVGFAGTPAYTAAKHGVNGLVKSAAREVGTQLSTLLGPQVLVRDWTRTNRNWYDAVQIEKRLMAIILTLIVAVAAFNIVSTLVMLVTDKQADIAILRTLGARPLSIMAVFVVQGALVALVGKQHGQVQLGAAGGAREVAHRGQPFACSTPAAKPSRPDASSRPQASNPVMT